MSMHALHIPRRTLTTHEHSHNIIESTNHGLLDYPDVQLSCRTSKCAKGPKVVWLSSYCEWLNFIVNAVLLVFPGQSVPAEEHVHYESVQALVRR